MPPAGTAEKWGYVFKLILAAVALAFAVWSLIALWASSLTTATGLALGLIPIWALLTAGLLVWDALTWRKNKPEALYLIPVALYRLGQLLEKLFSGRAVGWQDCGFLLLLAVLIVSSAINYQHERSAP